MPDDLGECEKELTTEEILKLPLVDQFTYTTLKTLRGMKKDIPQISSTLKLKFKCNQCGRNVPNIGATCDGCGCAIIGNK